MNKDLDREQRVKNVASAVADLKRLGVDFFPRLTSQSPNYYIRSQCSWQDGSKYKSTGLSSKDPSSLQKVVDLCMALHKDPTLLDSRKHKAQKSAFSAWGALCMKLEQHLTENLRVNVAGHTDYKRHLRELSELTGPVTPAKVQAWAEADPKDSRHRFRKLTTMRSLISIGVEVDSLWWTKLQGESHFNGFRAINPREIPSDEMIQKFVDSISNPQWQQVFGLIAVYGLRSSEPFCLESHTDSDGWIEISEDSKTGYRVVMPRRTDWLDRWNLWDLDLPEGDPKRTPREKGSRTCRYFNRHPEGATWRKPTAYSLRHAYAARIYTLREFDHLMPHTTARYMGHSEKIHREYYQRWIVKKELKEKAKREARGG